MKKKLVQKIIENIRRNHGKISFFDYMNTVLYHPIDGYYTSNSAQFGQEGDFITASEISPLFAQCIIRSILPVLHSLKDPMIVEFGAGTGKLALEILQSLTKSRFSIKKYVIIEISASLKKHQEALLKDYLSQVMWINDMDELSPQNIEGIILANEVIDAFPVMKFCWNNKNIHEYYVTEKNGQLNWLLDKPEHAHQKQFEPELDFIKQLNLPEPYTSEFQPQIKTWIKKLNHALFRGSVLIFDYGFSRNEFYHPDRSEGTIMCHYKHSTNSNPFENIGLQDITAHVDFTTIAEAGFDNGFEISGFTTQAAFLLSLGIIDLCQSYEDKQAVKLLTLPSEMGELIKVIALSKKLPGDIKPLGFELQDRRMVL